MIATSFKKLAIENVEVNEEANPFVLVLGADGDVEKVEKSEFGGAQIINDVSATVSGIVNNVSLQELGGVDKLVNGIRIGKGGGNIGTNTALGVGGLTSNTSGQNNSSFGNLALSSNTSGNGNSALGSRALSKNKGGSNNLAFGERSGDVTSSSSDNTGGSDSVFIGAFSKPLSNTQNNQIVIGYSAIGNGSNTATIGNDAIVKTVLKGAILLGKMTSVQRLAISSPEIGLQVYQTDGVEGVYINKSTGWIFAY